MGVNKWQTMQVYGVVRAILAFMYLFLTGCCWASPICPTNFVVHSVGDYSQRCCRAVDKCPVDHEIIICPMDGMDDRCVPCQKDYVQLDITSSWNRAKCFAVRRDCGEVKILKRIDGRDKCVCDRERNYFSITDGQTCDYRLEACPKGTEIQDSGNCQECQPGFFKSFTGQGLCKAQTDCGGLGLGTLSFGSSSCDAKCDSPDSQQDIKVHTTEVPSSTDQPSSTQPTKPATSIIATGNNGWNSWIFTGLLVITLIIVIAIIFYACGRRCFNDVKTVVSHSSQSSLVVTEHLLHRTEGETQPKVLDEPNEGVTGLLSDEGLYFVASKLGLGWEMIAAFLSVPQEVVEHAKLDNPHSALRQMFTALKHWRNKMATIDDTDVISDEDKVEQLLTALEKSEKTDLVEELCSKYEIIYCYKL